MSGRLVMAGVRLCTYCVLYVKNPEMTGFCTKGSEMMCQRTAEIVWRDALGLGS